MSDIIPFDNSKVPAYFSGSDASDLNKDLTAHDSGQYPLLSIRGKQFRVIRNGEESIVHNPKDPKSPASYINAVLVKVPLYTAKTYYDATFDANAAVAQKPVCWSNTGILPDASITKPCAVNCKICPKNQFGSAVNMDGTPSKAKACRDSLRAAIVSLGNLEEPMLLRIPPTSIKTVGQLGRDLQARGIPYNGVIMEISFDPNSVAQKLVFKPAGLLTQEQYATVSALYKQDIIKQITGLTDDVLSYAGEQTPVSAQPAVAKSVATGVVTPEAVKEADFQAPVKQEPTLPEIISSKEVKGLEGLDFDD